MFSWINRISWFTSSLSDSTISFGKSLNTSFRSCSYSGIFLSSIFSSLKVSSFQLIVDFMFFNQSLPITMFFFSNSVIYISIFRSIFFSFVSLFHVWYFRVLLVSSAIYTISLQDPLLIFISDSSVHFFLRKITSVSVSISLIPMTASPFSSVHNTGKIIRYSFSGFSPLSEFSRFPIPWIWGSFVCSTFVYVPFFHIWSISWFPFPLS